MTREPKRRYRYKVTGELYDYVSTDPKGLWLAPANPKVRPGDLVGHLLAALSELEPVEYDIDGDWVDMHLTPRGWIAGEEMNGWGHKTSRPTPTDRVKTVRLYRGKDESAERYVGDPDEVKPLLDHWGPP